MTLTNFTNANGPQNLSVEDLRNSIRQLAEHRAARPMVVPPAHFIPLPATVRKLVKRSWVERLFSRPWRPFEKFNSIWVENPALPPKGEVYFYREKNTYFVRPEDFERLKRTLIIP